MKYFFFLLFLVFTGYLSCLSPLRSSGLNFSDLPFYINDPDSYTMYLVDRSRITSEIIPSSGVPEEYKPYFRSDLFEEDKAIFSQEPPQNTKRWVRVSQAATNSCLIARLMMPSSSSAECFLERISTPLSADSEKEHSSDEHHTQDLGDFSFSGGMIIFPQNERYATIFTFGNAWKTLLNPYVIVPNWGLRIVASEGFCDPHQIREIAANYFRNPIPSKRKERSAGVEDISRFGIEVASEGLESLRVRPDSAYGMKRIVKGADYLNFCVTKRDKEKCETTFGSLLRVSTYFFSLSMQDSLSIHKSLSCFVDNEVCEESLVSALSEKLLTLIQSSEAVYSLFLHDWIWSLFDTKVLRFGEKATTQIHDHFSSVETLQSPIKIITVKGNRSSNVPVGRLLYSLPIEHEERFYRYDRGMWFNVDASRFEAIKKVMRSFKSTSQELGLPEYCLDDLMGDRKDYKELRYNKRAVRHLNLLPGHQAYLIDRLNITLKKGGGHIFEFGDIFLIKNGHCYIIHVKRADANALSHHREQVERSADYLGTTLNRKTNASFFLEASINDLLREHDIEKPKKQEGEFQKALKGRHDNSRNIENLLATPDIKPEEKNAQTLHNFKGIVLRVLRETDTINFFNQHLDAFCEALDVLFLCVQEGKIDLDEESNNTEIMINSFIERARFAIEGGTALFSNGLLKKAEQRKLTFVLAVVDDRGVEQFVDTEIKKEDKKLKKGEAKKVVLDRFREDEKRFIEHVKHDKSSSLFNSQDLWGLDRTRMAIQKQGFPFLLVVTNEYRDETWDAFGSIGNAFKEDEETGEDREKGDFLEQTKEIPWPKGTHETTKDGCNKIVMHMRNNPSTKYTKVAIEKSTKLKNAATPLEKLLELKVIEREKVGRSYQHFLSEDYKAPVKSEKPSTIKATVSKKLEQKSKALGNKENLSDNDHITDEDYKLDIGNVYKRTKNLGKVGKINLSISQKFIYNGVTNPVLGIYGEYISCPTIGDGNCLFHATFTQEGEDQEVINVSATAIRATLCNVVPADGYLAGCRCLVYEEYLRRSVTPSITTIPEPMRTMFRENHEHASARNYVVNLLQTNEQLPARLRLPYIYTEDDIRTAIPAATAKDYMKRFRYNFGVDSYIPVRREMICPVEFIALQNNVRLNVFTFNCEIGALDLLKSVGVPGVTGNNPIHNILIEGAHYVALINPAESDARKNAVIQIMKNAGYIPR